MTSSVVRARFVAAFALAVLLLPVPHAVAQLTTLVQTPPPSTPSAPVVVWGQTITTFRAPVGGVPPNARAAQASRRIQALPSGLPAYEIEVHPTVLGAITPLGGLCLLAGWLTIAVVGLRQVGS